ncbi:MAG: hypothetical protein KIT56_04750 [Gammaproteobacteria bacterium]|nr:hypothetical protein [Gammaproteobacteria bacterium]MCW5583186.1 hypothetical protein [Gammaproteobacteria bacterium]
MNKRNNLFPVKKLIKEEKFIADKYYMFLKRILIPKEVYQAIGTATISSDSY